MERTSAFRAVWRRRLWSVTALAGLITGAAGAVEVPGPRPLSEAERAAVLLADLYFSHGAAAWWPHLAEDAPLRGLGQEAAVQEIRLRLGPPEGATWRLTTPARDDGRLVVFSIEYLSGFDETVVIEMVRQERYLKIRDVRSRVDPVNGPTGRLGRLLALRDAMALGLEDDVESHLRQVPKEGLLIRVARLWEAQYRLADLAAAATAAALKLDEKEFPGPPLPLAALLRARLAFVRYDSLQMATAYDVAIEHSVDHDDLRLESLEGQAFLGFLDESGYRKLAEMGSRLADTYYTLSRTAVYHKEEGAVELFKIAWHLEPMEREALFENPLLARLCLEDEVHRWTDLDSPEEPRMGPPEKGRRPLPFSPAAQVLVSGFHLSLLYGGDSEIEVPGGAVLAPQATAWEDAGAERRRREEAALGQLKELVEAARSPTALAHPRLRRRMETAALALAVRKRWADLLRLTHGIADQMEHAGETLARLRALALGKLGYDREAILLLKKLADSDEERRNPGVLYQLAELAADHERYDIALLLIKKADSMLPIEGASGRLWQVMLDHRLAKSHRQYQSAHFTLRYPPDYTDEFAAKIAQLLEHERRRLHAWIPAPPDQPVDVSLFPAPEFSLAFGGEVLGLYDGKIRIPVTTSGGRSVVRTDVLSHELVHALIAEYAGEAEVPVWFNEGLATYLEHVQPTKNPIPDLHRRQRLLSMPMVDAVLDGFAPPVLTGQAYEEAAWSLRFLNARFGLSGIRRLLEAFKAGQEPRQALAGVLGLTPAEFHEAMWSWAGSSAAQALLAEEPEPESARPKVGFNPDLEARFEAEIMEYVDGLREWYRYYSARVRPSKKSLRIVVGGLRERSPVPMREACTELERELTGVMQDPKVFDSPNIAAGNGLATAYRHFRKMAAQCRQGHASLVQVELEKAEAALRRVALALEPFGLKP